MKVEVQLETITPLFLGGADPRGEPELRAASFRGVLRFWWRALVGGIVGDFPERLDDLRKAESAVFGSTDTGVSPLVVRVTGEHRAQPYRPLLHSSSKTFKFQGIMPGKPVTLTLAPHPPHATLPEATFGALIMFVILGGLGKRSRRGFGSFLFLSTEDEFPMSLPDYSNEEAFSKQLRSLIAEAQESAKVFMQTLKINITTASNLPCFPILHEKNSKVLFCNNSFPSWEQAMKSFWSVLRTDPYRDNRVFGFAGKEGRQASPLHLRIVKLGEAYHILLTAFRISFQKEQPSWQVMQNFLDECKSQWKGEWVFGGSVQW